MDMHAYEQAAAEYQRALGAWGYAGGDDSVGCELLLRLGAAQARAGDYRHAAESCQRAAEISRRLGAPEQLARAALGLGERQVEGGIVNRQLVALLEEALEALGTEDSPLRARLLARLSLELTFSDETDRMKSLSDKAVAMARRLGDPAALRMALDTRWMAVWGPDGLEERTALADEVLRLGRETGDREMELDGHATRAATSLESGDIRTVWAEVAAHARLTEELPIAIHRWRATTMRALRALLVGAFADAERLADEALTLQPGRPNAMFTHLVQVALARWEQGELGEMRGELQAVVDRFPRAAFAGAWLALAHAELGDSDDGAWGLALAGRTAAPAASKRHLAAGRRAGVRAGHTPERSAGRRDALPADGALSRPHHRLHRTPAGRLLRLGVTVRGPAGDRHGEVGGCGRPLRVGNPSPRPARGQTVPGPNPL